MDGLSILRSSTVAKHQMLGGGIGNLVVAICLLVPAEAAQAKQPDLTFDVPTVVSAQTVDAALAGRHANQGNLVRIQIPVSAYIEPRFQGTVSEYVVQIESPLRTIQVRDYWPRRESVTNIAGNVRVEQSNQSESNLGAKASGGFAVVANGTLEAGYRSNSITKESYERLP